MRTVILIMLLTGSSLRATTYYVDYVGGSDSNDGTSAVTAWKHCPGDASATGTPAGTTLAAGDTVIFKGGVTYVTGGITVNASGASDESRIVFDGNSGGAFGTGKAIITSSNVELTAIDGGTRNYITIQNFRFTDIGGYTEDDPIWDALGTFTVNASTDVITTSSSHGLTVGDIVGFRSTGTLPAGIATRTEPQYEVHEVVSATEIRIIDPDSASYVDITDTGTGTHSWWIGITEPPSGVGIKFTGGTGAVISNCDFDEIGQWQILPPMTGTLSMTGTAIALENTVNATISSCDMTRVRTGVSIKTENAGTVGPVLVEDCTIHHYVVWGLDIAPRSAGSTLTGIVIRGCTIYNHSQCDSGNWLGFGQNPHRDGIFLRTAGISCTWNETIIERCLFYDDDPADSNGGTASVFISQGPTVTLRNNLFLNDPQGPGAVSIGGLGKVPAQTIKVYNNTFVTSARPLNMTPGSVSVLDIKNNIFYRTSGATATINALSDRTSAPTKDYSNNIYYSVYTPLESWRPFYDGGYKTFAQWQALGFDTVGSVLANPLLTSTSGNPSTWDLEPQPGSPAVAAGEDLSSTGFSTDFFGNARPSGAWDIGAVQFSAGGGSPPSAPSNLAVTGTTSSSISLSWTDNASDEEGFVLERSLTTSTGFSAVATPAANATSYTDTGLSSNTTYYYRLKAFNDAGDSAYSSEATGATDALSGGDVSIDVLTAGTLVLP